MPRSEIDILLNLVPDNPAAVLQHLSTNPSLASQQDFSGYSLLHAASSYSHPDLIRTLVAEYKVDVNLKDEDGETAVFVAEQTEVAQLLVELGVDLQIRNAEGLTAAEKLEGEGDWPALAAYLRSIDPASHSNGVAQTTGSTTGSRDTQLSHPPPLPSDDIKIEFGTMTAEEEQASGAPDPELRRRIEELAARDDFQTEAGQRELRELITDAVLGLREGAGEQSEEGDRSRRKVD